MCSPGQSNMFATLRDLDSQSMVATEASTEPPPYHRPPHLVCQLCRSKKLKCSGFSPEGCARCRASNVQCVSVSRSTRNGTVRKSQKINLRGQRRGPSMDFRSEPNLSTSSPSEHSDDVAARPMARLDHFADVDQDACLEPFSAYETRDPVIRDFLPPFPPSYSPGGNPSNPDSADQAPSRNNSPSQHGLQTLEPLWRSFPDSLADGPCSDLNPCQCIQQALEMLDEVYVQDYTPGPASLGDNGSTFQNLATLRSGIQKLESLTICNSCRGAQRLMTLLVLLFERLLTNLHLILEASFPNALVSGLLASSTFVQKESRGACPVTHAFASGESTCYNDPGDGTDAIVTLYCGMSSLDVTAETSALLTLLHLTTLQQLRRVLSKLWDRAQVQQWTGHLKTLRHHRGQLHAMYVAMKARLTVESS
ncbi:Zn(II)2Cys6 transcription factor domain-containing protein [Aspergillus melleus]|uniref:Zn(II)2Cys6 transcription factor domain-containing protein n=1 Tax=Aspergillus melleus TaxID=138277 RepID=UPI001E8EC3EC|nr:uncharacterized protein LDX57_009719 [Aspergillus melleus]KAH8432072.1 hypothetical protein LDX57_009719 [Aspergillus melleus]